MRFRIYWGWHTIFRKLIKSEESKQETFLSFVKLNYKQHIVSCISFTILLQKFCTQIWQRVKGRIYHKMNCLETTFMEEFSRLTLLHSSPIRISAKVVLAFNIGDPCEWNALWRSLTAWDPDFIVIWGLPARYVLSRLASVPLVIISTVCFLYTDSPLPPSPIPNRTKHNNTTSYLFL